VAVPIIGTAAIRFCCYASIGWEVVIGRTQTLTLGILVRVQAPANLFKRINSESQFRIHDERGEPCAFI